MSNTIPTTFHACVCYCIWIAYPQECIHRWLYIRVWEYCVWVCTIDQVMLAWLFFLHWCTVPLYLFQVSSLNISFFFRGYISPAVLGLVIHLSVMHTSIELHKVQEIHAVIQNWRSYRVQVCMASPIWERCCSTSLRVRKHCHHLEKKQKHNLTGEVWVGWHYHCWRRSCQLSGRHLTILRDCSS